MLDGHVSSVMSRPPPRVAELEICPTYSYLVRADCARLLRCKASMHRQRLVLRSSDSC
jgi:hypothetical protein